VEFVLSTIKVLGCIGFIILGVVIDCGGTGNQGYLGAHYWHDPGAFVNGFKGFCSVFVVAAFAFGGTELVGLAAAEAENPRKSLPQATKQVFWRITFFYVVSLFIVGLIVPANDPNLLNATSGADSRYSPFVIAIRLAGIKGLPSVFNVIITISVISVANSCTYGSTRTMQALAERGMAPKLLAYVDSKGRPIYGVIIQLLFGLLAFIGESGKSTTVFNWLLSLSGLSDFFVWGGICLAHIRFRAAWKAQGHVKDELPYQAMFGVIGSWYGLILNILCMIATFYVALFVSESFNRTLFNN
jgi:amino acid transporter